MRLLLLFLVGCAGGAPYASFSEVEYEYRSERTIWGQRSRLEVHYALAGTSSTAETPLVLLHPWGFNGRIWEQTARSWGEDRQVLVVDLPGHGKSDKTHAYYPMERLAAAVLDAMDAAGVKRAFVVGNSLGGATTLALARMAPERLRGMVLIGSPGGKKFIMPLRTAARQLAKPLELQGLSDESWWLGLKLLAPGGSAHAASLRGDFLRLKGARDYTAWSQASLDVLQQAAEYAPPLGDVQVPALIVHGQNDPLIWRSLSEALKDGLPQARMVVLEGCGHMPQMECPAQLVPHVLTFIRAGR